MSVSIDPDNSGVQKLASCAVAEIYQVLALRKWSH